MVSRRLIIALLAGLPPAAGCASARVSGHLRAESLGVNPVFLDRKFTTSVYAQLNSTETSFYLTDIPLADLLAGNVGTGMVVHLDLLWVPSAGDTPMDSSATNVSIRYVLFAEGEVGIYGGAGFAMPRGEVGDGTMSLSLRDASLTLLDSTDGFVDLLSPARLTGRLTAKLDLDRSRRLAWAVNQIVTNALGYVRLVEKETGSLFRFEKETRSFFPRCEKETRSLFPPNAIRRRCSSPSSSSSGA